MTELTHGTANQTPSWRGRLSSPASAGVVVLDRFNGTLTSDLKWPSCPRRKMEASSIEVISDEIDFL